MGSAGKERRKSKRREILHSFGAFVVVKKKGVHRLVLHDISEHGIGFDLDIEGETAADFPISKGEILDIQFYFNPTLAVDLKVKAAHIERSGAVRKIGAELVQSDPSDPQNEKARRAYFAYLTFIAQFEG